MTTKVGPKGQVVIPKAIRDQLGIHPGDEVVVVAADDEVRIARARGLKGLRGILRGTNAREELEREHRAELEKDERRLAELERRGE